MVVSIIQIMFAVNMLNTRVVDNLDTLLSLEFHVFWPASLGVIDLVSSPSVFACFINKSDR